MAELLANIDFGSAGNSADFILDGWGGQEGTNTLLWTVPGESSGAGEVDVLAPAFMRGHLGEVNLPGYASHDAWLSILTNAYAR